VIFGRLQQFNEMKNEDAHIVSNNVKILMDYIINGFIFDYYEQSMSFIEKFN